LNLFRYKIITYKEDMLSLIINIDKYIIYIFKNKVKYIYSPDTYTTYYVRRNPDILNDVIKITQN